MGYSRKIVDCWNTRKIPKAQSDEHVSDADKAAHAVCHCKAFNGIRLVDFFFAKRQECKIGVVGGMFVDLAADRCWCGAALARVA